MKKIILIVIMVLTAEAAFCSKYGGFYDGGLHSRGLIAGGTVMMAIPAVPLIIFSVGIISDLASGELWTLGSYYTPFLSSVYITSYQLTIAGALMMYLGIKRYHCATNNYFATTAEMMRNVGIVILTTAAVPTAITGLVSAFFVAQDRCFTFWAVADGLLSLYQFAAGAVFLGLGIYNMDFGSKYIPEISMSKEEVTVGMRIRI